MGLKFHSTAVLLRCAAGILKKICLGGYTEAKSGIIESKYPSDIMRGVAEYIHTNTTHLLSLPNEKTKDVIDVTDADINRIRSQVKLATAAVFYDLPGLVRLLKQRVLGSLRQKPSLAFVLLEACHQEKPETPEEIHLLSLSAIRSVENSVLINEKSVGVLSQTVLQSILEDDRLEMDESKLFEIIKLWLASTPDCENRQFVATQLVGKHIKLELIDPDVLSSSVEPSGLASPTQLAKAYKEQALAAKQSYGVAFKRPRFVLPYGKWKSSLTDTVTLDGLDTGSGDVLHFAPVTTHKLEVHQWTIKD